MIDTRCFPLPMRGTTVPAQAINSIDRALLNEDLLDEAAGVPGVNVFFNHKVTSLNFDTRTMSVQDLDLRRDVQVPFDFCVGADGSYSIVRRQLMRVVRWVLCLSACNHPPFFAYFRQYSMG